MTLFSHIFYASDVGKVCSRRHTVGGKKLQIYEYHHSIGVLPVGFDTSSKKAWLPPPQAVEWDSIGMKYILSCNQHRQAIDAKLARCDAKVAWPESPEGHMQLLCELSPHMPDFEQRIDRWVHEAFDVLNTELQNITWKTVNVPKDIWERFIQDAGNLDTLSGGRVLAAVDKRAGKIQLTGAKDRVDRVEQHLIGIRDTLQAQLSLKRKIKENTDTNLKPYQAKLLEAKGFADEMEHKYEHLEVEFRDGKVKFKGLQDNITQAQTDMFSLLADQIEDSMPVSRELAEIAQSSVVEEYINDQLGGALVAWESNPSKQKVTVYAFDRSTVQHGVQIIKDNLLEESVQLTPKQADIVKSREWTSHLDRIKQNHKGKIALNTGGDNSKIAFVGIAEAVQPAINKVKEYLDKNTILSETVKVGKGKSEYIKKFKTYELSSLRRELRSGTTMDWDHGGADLVLQGTGENIRKVKQKVDDLIKKVCYECYTLDKAEILTYLKSPEGDNKMFDIQDKHKVYIEMKENDGRVSRQQSSQGAQGGHRGGARRYDQHRQRMIFIIGFLPLLTYRSANLVTKPNIRVCLSVRLPICLLAGFAQIEATNPWGSHIRPVDTLV